MADVPFSPAVQDGIQVGAAKIQEQRTLADSLKDLSQPRSIVIQPTRLLALAQNAVVKISQFLPDPVNNLKGVRAKLDIINVGSEPVLISVGQNGTEIENYHYPVAACSQNGVSASTTDNGTGGALNLDWARCDVYASCVTGAGKLSIVEARFPSSP